jgi:rfaE bifunctional protein nucleotidyltransferase chain/domain
MGNSKIKSQAELEAITKELREKGKVVVATNGCFDILHLAHINLLEKAKKEGDVLVILLNSDMSIKNFKAINRPIIPEGERAEMLAALECVDYITLFEEDDPNDLIKKLKPHKVAKGGTFIPERVAEHKRVLSEWGGEMVHFPLEEGYSSTGIIGRIKETQ